MLEIFITLIAALIPILLWYFGNRLLKKQHEIERRHKKRIQFDLDAQIFKPQKGNHIVEVNVILHNQGLVRLMVDKIRLKVLAVGNNEDILLFSKDSNPDNLDSIAFFPIKLVDTYIPQSYNKNKESDKKDKNVKDRYFVEPGVKQQFGYVARISDKIRFILIRAYFEYHENSKHSAQKVFDLKAT